MMYGHRRRLSPEETAANAAKREARLQAAMHCQCCGRAILANRGVIAHHGYERPGSGWQTASCFGAKRLPWEVDRSALADLIRFLKDNLKRQLATRKAAANEEFPIVHEYEIRKPGHHEYDKHVIRVTRSTFDEVKASTPLAFRNWYNVYDFDSAKKQDLTERDYKISRIKKDIKEFQTRYDGWKQTHKRENDQWVKI